MNASLNCLVNNTKVCSMRIHGKLENFTRGQLIRYSLPDCTTDLYGVHVSFFTQKGPTNPIYAEPSSPTHPPPLPLSRPPGPPSFPNHLTIDSDAAASRQSTQSAYSLAPEVPPQNFSVEDIRELNLSLSEIALAGSQQSLSDSSSSLLPRVIPPPPPGFTTAADADARGSTSPVPPEVPVYDSPMSPPPHIPPRNYSEEDVAEGKPEVDDASRQLELEVEKLTALAEEIGESTSAF